MMPWMLPLRPMTNTCNPVLPFCVENVQCCSTHDSDGQVGDLEADAGAAWVHGIDSNPLIEDGWIRSEDRIQTDTNCLT